LLSYSTSVIFIEISDSDKYVAFLEYHGDDEISNFDHILLKLLYVCDVYDQTYTLVIHPINHSVIMIE
jgi:hypothetical protein